MWCRMQGIRVRLASTRSFQDNLANSEFRNSGNSQAIQPSRHQTLIHFTLKSKLLSRTDSLRDVVQSELSVHVSIIKIEERMSLREFQKRH